MCVCDFFWFLPWYSNTYKFFTTTQKHICSLVAMMNMRHHIIIICFKFTTGPFTRPSVLRIVPSDFNVLGYKSRHDNRYEYIILAYKQQSQPQIILYCADIFLS